MIYAVADRLRAVERVVGRATLVPLMVRGGICASTLMSYVLAYPTEIVTSRAASLLLVAAVLPALRPSRLWPTLAPLVAVGGWVLSTSGYGEPVVLWRLLALAACLYLAHSLSALATVLPYDAVLAGEAVARWVLRALAVVLASAVLAILLLDLAGPPGDNFLAAVVGGLVVAVGVGVLLTWLLRRR